MNNDSYFVISGSEDGGCSCQELSKEELLKRLAPDKHGDTYYGCRQILNKLPAEIDNFVDLVIIKGRVIVPKPVQTVTEYELP